MAELVLEVDVNASPEAVWAAMTDWDRQGEWMFLTNVRGTKDGGQGVGGELEAFTGVGRIGFLDTMTITAWDPPRRCVVLHTGRVVRGSASFEVTPLPDGRARFTWAEWLVLPLGWVGELGFLVVKPFVRAPMRRSMRRFAEWAAARTT